MRNEFWKQLYKEMKKNSDIFVLVGDLGFGGADKIRDDFPRQFLNTGASEQTMLDIAVGLAYSGKIPFCYTITSFYLRGAETISTYIAHEQLAVNLVGSGRNQEYEHDGWSHNSIPTDKFIKLLDIEKYYPKDKKEISKIVKQMIKRKKPTFLSLSKKI